MKISKKYFTISEFAKLRSIDINSLRYYEKLGILIPAYVDINTKYRYYSAEQLAKLDIILLCISLDIPLKNLQGYIDENGTFRTRALFEDGKQLAEEKIRELRNRLSRIEHNLNYIEDIEKYADNQGIYTRIFEKRILVTEQLKCELSDVKTVETTFDDLHSYARAEKLNPVMPMGILLKYTNSTLKKYACLELAEKETNCEKTIILPKAEYQCVQVKWDIAVDIQNYAEDIFDISKNATVFISNVAQSRFRIGTRIGEIQKLIS